MLLVVAFHVKLPGLHGGFVGVDIFFVLSGFLITTILLAGRAHAGGLGYGRFLWRRALRLYPALVLFLAGTALAFPLLFPDRSLGREWAYVLGYVANYSRILTGAPDVLRHSWSLAVEVQFYLLWPLVVAGLARLRRATGLVVVLGLFLAATVWRMQAYAILGPAWAYNATDSRISGLLIGAAVAFLPAASARRGGIAADLAGLAALGTALALSRYYTPVTAAILAPVGEIGAALVVARLAAGAGPLVAALSVAPAVKLGQWSYGIYLWHYPVALALRDRIPAPAALAIALGVAVICAALSYELVERRLARLRAVRTPP